MRSASSPLRVGIVGVGPKGLYCFERLVAHAGRSRRAYEVDLFEPTGAFGAGAVYATGQLECLSMNFADELIDAWPPSTAAAPGADARSYADWLAGRAGELADADRGAGMWAGYSARARVGRYLGDCFEAVLRSVPANVSVRCHAARVESVERAGESWTVAHSAAGTAADAVTCDEVMLAVGHNRTEARPGEMTLSYPARHALSIDAVPPGARVRVRGIALTAIDLALMLSEGRGGRFVTDARPGRLRYLASGREPGCLTLGSRTGRTMAAKPDPRRYGEIDGVRRARERGLERLRERTTLRIDSDLMSELGRTAAELLAATGVVEPDRVEAVAPRCAATLRGRLEPTFEPPAVAWQRLVVSLDVAVGSRAPDAFWALGEAWRALYPAIVDVGGHGGIPDDEWPRFTALAKEMERLAFGPPPLPVAKLLALADAGIVELAPEPFPEHHGAHPELTVDAVLAPPGPGPPGTAPVWPLMDAGHARLAGGGRRGLEVDEAGGCIGRSGKATPGLAAVGRLTEDWVIGNDTLSRRLHSHPDAWARRIASPV